MDKQESFETSLEKLEVLIEKLEQPELPLDQSLQFFEEGIKLARICESKLREAEGKLQKLIQDDEGNFEKQDFDL